jgi:hypothetical protein
MKVIKTIWKKLSSVLCKNEINTDISECIPRTTIVRR